jgi:hypothetical protein
MVECVKTRTIIDVFNEWTLFRLSTRQTYTKPYLLNRIWACSTKIVGVYRLKLSLWNIWWKWNGNPSMVILCAYSTNASIFSLFFFSLIAQMLLYDHADANLAFYSAYFFNNVKHHSENQLHSLDKAWIIFSLNLIF